MHCKEYMWYRCGKVITLGELFMLLGREYTAAAIYALYRTLRIVSLKRRKGQLFVRGSASQWIGITGGDLQASRIRRHLGSDTSTKDLLVQSLRATSPHSSAQ